MTLAQTIPAALLARARACTVLLLAVIAMPSAAQDMSASALARPPEKIAYTIVNTYPHDRDAFTQGLVYRDGHLYESTGLNGRSSLREVELATGKVLRKHDVEPQYFAEGLADVGQHLVQLTWQSQVGFVYDRKTFKLERTFKYHGEGWGLVHDGKRLILSDGSATLRFLDATTFVENGRLEVTYQGQPMRQLNELEMVKGDLLANVWGTPFIVVIDLASGRVTGQIDCTTLLGPEDRTPPVDVLNGIAWDAKKERLFVTGKLWPKLFELRLQPASASGS
jgi:glutaminyl-peptide cyclotransferase